MTLWGLGHVWNNYYNFEKKELLIHKQLEFLPVETLIEYG